MKIVAFRVWSFKSIIDSSWINFSHDGITVFVGQNESGKSSILEALNYALTDETPTDDDIRIDSGPPRVHFRIEILQNEAKSKSLSLSDVQRKALCQYLKEHNNIIEFECRWEKDSGSNIYVSLLQPIGTKLEEILKKERLNLGTAVINSDQPAVTNPNDFDSAVIGEENESSEEDNLTSETDLYYEIYKELPLGVLFSEESGQLPDQVDINDKFDPTGEGARAALNFLRIADISLPDLLNSSLRARENTLAKANQKVSEDFNKFWSQTIGNTGRLSLKCDIRNYSSSSPEKVGNPHLVYWICDGTNQLYPKQRSKGVRWFVSFYLQLKASENAKNKRIFLLDEPGANLHSKAQGDVLKLINELGKDTSTVVYSTHSPQMLEYAKLYRVHAVQRDGSADDSPTIIIDAHKLGTASTDTLSPVFMAMGADLSQQQVIQKSNNVLVEEMSGYYYMTAFWILSKASQDAHFIAATGVNKLELLANMFRGWGLEFIVAVDDDKQGREVYNNLKRNLFGDDDDVAARILVKLKPFSAIEDVFDQQDFLEFVVGDTSQQFTCGNGDFLKQTKRSKPIIAYQFKLAVERGDITFEQFSVESRKRIQSVVDMLADRLT
jgi:energy-coupling factor transporter ATP-binding protein EcfA2